MEYPIVAFDLGARRIGVALCPMGTLVLEQPTITLGNRPLLDQLIEVASRLDTTTLVIGGTRSGFGPTEVAALQARLSIPIHVVDEALTTKEAERQLADEGRTRLPAGRQGDSDARAARLILEQFLGETSKQL